MKGMAMTTETEKKMVRFTAPVRRGLVLVRGLLVDSFDDDATPSKRQVASWTSKQQRDFNAAQAWLEQVEDELPKAPELVTTIKPDAQGRLRAVQGESEGGAPC